MPLRMLSPNGSILYYVALPILLQGFAQSGPNMAETRPSGMPIIDGDAAIVLQEAAEVDERDAVIAR